MRRRPSTPRDIPADRKYGNSAVAKFINYVMRQGKKNAAEKAVYGALDIIQKKHNLDPLAVFQQALGNAAPLLQIRSRRIGGATYQVPREVSPRQRMSLAFRWIINAARSRSGKPMAEKLAEELMLAYKNEGAAVKRKLDMHRMAEANKAFAHFAW